MNKKSTLRSVANDYLTHPMRIKGITLISLVITVIVLLILAGVSITMLTGDNSILNQATNAKIETRGGTVQEQVALWKNEKIAKNMTGTGTVETLEQLVNRLVSENLLTEDEKDQILGNDTKGIEATGQVTIGSRTIVFDTGKTLVEAFIAGDIAIGDYINYTPKYTSTDVNGKTTVYQQDTGYFIDADSDTHDDGQSYTVNSSASWKVLGLDKTGTKLLITTENPIARDGENPYLFLKGAESYYNCVSTLNKICAIYSNSDYASSPARSMTMEDLDNALGVVVEKNSNNVPTSVYLKSDETKASINVYGNSRTSYTYGQNGDSSTDYAPENYMKNKYNISTITEKYKTDTVYNTGYAYMIPSTLETTDPLYTLLFAGTLDSDKFAKAYWLASPGVRAYSSYCDFGPGFVYLGGAGSGNILFESNGNWSCGSLAVRPVVSLDSEITVKQLETSKTAFNTDAEKFTDNSTLGQSDGSLSSEDKGYAIVNSK